MYESTKILEQKGKLQKELRSERYTFLTGQEEDFAQRQSEMREKILQVDDLEERLIKALAAEEYKELTEFADAHAREPVPAEHRERQEITRKAKLVTIVDAVIAQRAATGAEREAQAAWNCELNEVPLPMLPGLEMRVIDAPNDGGGPRTLQYVFGGSMAQAANIVRPAVPPGTYTFPSFVDGTAGARPAHDVRERRR